MAPKPNIPNLDGLTALADRDGVDIKPTLLRVMTDLYVQKPQHSADEERHYVELAGRLIDEVDAATRAIVAERLRGYAAAPKALTERLAGGRPAAAPEPTPTSTSDAKLAELSELFLGASAQERRMILLHLDCAALPQAAPIARELAQDAIRRLEMAALNHNGEGFAREIERALGIAREAARRLIDDPSGEPVLVLAMALDMPADVLQRILLCLNPAVSHSVLRVYELSTLYEELDRPSALRLTAIWQAVHKAAQRPALKPQHYDDGKAAQPGLPARPAIRWDDHALRRSEG